MTTWFITGAATGLGRALAEEVLRRGDNAVVTGRELGALTELADAHADHALAVQLDVTSDAQRTAALARAEERFGGVDVLVNNAAVDFVGAVEEQTDADIRTQFEVNVFGALALTRLVLPGMRTRRRGTIVNISSMDGIASLPGNGIYSATKFALEGLTEALAGELEPIGLRALLVEPGSFRTGIQNRTSASGDAIADYEATGGVFRSFMGTIPPEAFPGDPARGATVIYDTVTAEPARHWLVLGSDAQRRIQAKLDTFTAEFEAGAELAASTDYPDSGPAVL